MSNEIILDVRNDLREKKDPFKKIIQTVKSLKKDEVFILHSTIKPTPLFTIMKARGYKHHVEKIGHEHYVTRFTKTSSGFFGLFSKKEKENKLPATEEEPLLNEEEPLLNEEEQVAFFLDNRGLQPPQPMVRTMKRLELLKQNEILTIHNDRVPVFLLEELKEQGIDYTVDNLEDGSAKVHLKKL
ncbi:DUF2249 domain-containing protein [Evansella sp. AB-rgal1]|uniref:DUF2249 domain-containing protein n=1 Tax=Evansella sp. AB-rgal1 TaxID=3242696 RepID=UPI00359E86FD